MKFYEKVVVVTIISIVVCLSFLGLTVVVLNAIDNITINYTISTDNNTLELAEMAINHQECECVENKTEHQLLEEKYNMSITEPALYQLWGLE